MFAKIFDQIFDSSIASNYTVRHIFMDLLVLSDSDGCIDMTYDAISRRTNAPAEVVVNGIRELMQADPESRSPKEHGARLVPIDKSRSWGWRIVNYQHYRNIVTEEMRRQYWRDKQRESRARRKNDESVKDGQRPNGFAEGKTVQPVNECQTSQQMSSYAEAEGEAVPLQSPNDVKDIPDVIIDVADAKRSICERILTGSKPGQLWSPDAEDRLARLCEQGLSRQEIDDVAWFKPFRREPHTPTKLMMYWTDEVHRSREARKKIGGGKTDPQKQEPKLWREFFQWKHGDNVVLPKSFWQLPKDRQLEYNRDFQTFESAQKKEAAAQ